MFHLFLYLPDYDQHVSTLCPHQHTYTHNRQHTTDTIHTTDTTEHTQHTCLVLILVVMASVSGQAIVVGGGLVGMSLKGGAKKPELAQLFCGNSGADVEWLLDKFNLDLSLVARFGPW